MCANRNNTPSLCCLGKYLRLKEFMKSLIKFISYKYLGFSEINITPGSKGVITTQDLKEVLLSYASEPAQMLYLIENSQIEVEFPRYRTSSGAITEMKGNFSIIANSEAENDHRFLEISIESNTWKRATKFWCDKKNALNEIGKIKKVVKQLKEFDKANSSNLNKITINEKQKRSLQK